MGGVAGQEHAAGAVGLGEPCLADCADSQIGVLSGRSAPSTRWMLAWNSSSVMGVLGSAGDWPVSRTPMMWVPGRSVVAISRPAGVQFQPGAGGRAGYLDLRVVEDATRLGCGEVAEPDTSGSAVPGKLMPAWIRAVLRPPSQPTR